MNKIYLEKKFLAVSLVLSVLILIVFSIGMIASVSFTRSMKDYGTYYFFLKRQIMWAILGIIVFIIFARIDYRKYKKYAPYLYFIGIILLVLVLIIGKEINGAKRWIVFPFFSFQPSEFAKILAILSLSLILYNIKTKPKEKQIGIHLFIILLFTYCGLVYFEKSFSSTLHLALIGFGMLFLSNINLLQYFTYLFSLSGVGLMVLMRESYRRKRIISYFSSLKDIKKIDYQSWQSLIAIGNGNMFGKSYGNGIQKYFFLPEIHTDYIFAGYAEEFGFFGCVVLLLIYCIIILIMVTIAVKIKDWYARYIMVGILILFSTQVLINVAVVTGIIPSTGVPLPFLSYGGSSILATMIYMGICFNILTNIGRD